MRKLFSFAVLVFVILGLNSVASAGIRERIRDQQVRIDQGIASGQLTRHEADTLQQNLDWIRTEFERLGADGRMTPAELQKLDRLLDGNDKMIGNKKHNPVTTLNEEEGKPGGPIPDRIQKQQARISEGIRSGELTPGEAEILKGNLERIRNEFQRLKRDGLLTEPEKDRLNRMLDRNSEMIAAKKHNRNAPVEKLAP